MNKYLKAQIKTNEAIIASDFTSDELERFSTSDFRWADNHPKPFSYRTIKKGEIYQFEFGKNYKPEMSYEHRGLVIGVKQKLLYVLPIFSYNPQKHTDVYHPTDNPTSKSDMFLLKACEFSFIGHDSVLKLNDIRTVSVNRILYKQNGILSPSTDTYKIIEKLAFQKYFPNFHYENTQLQQKLISLEKQNDENQNTMKMLILENESLKEQIITMQKHLTQNPT